MWAALETIVDVVRNIFILVSFNSSTLIFFDNTTRITEIYQAIFKFLAVIIITCNELQSKLFTKQQQI